MTLRMVKITRKDKEGKSHSEIRMVDIPEPTQKPRNRAERRRQASIDRKQAKLNKNKEAQDE